MAAASLAPPSAAEKSLKEVEDQVRNIQNKNYTYFVKWILNNV
jgi:hypothetical protein